MHLFSIKAAHVLTRLVVGPGRACIVAMCARLWAIMLLEVMVGHKCIPIAERMPLAASSTKIRLCDAAACVRLSLSSRSLISGVWVQWIWCWCCWS